MQGCIHPCTYCFTLKRSVARLLYYQPHLHILLFKPLTIWLHHRSLGLLQSGPRYPLCQASSHLIYVPPSHILGIPLIILLYIRYFKMGVTGVTKLHHPLMGGWGHKIGFIFDVQYKSSKFQKCSSRYAGKLSLIPYVYRIYLCIFNFWSILCLYDISTVCK